MVLALIIGVIIFASRTLYSSTQIIEEKFLKLKLTLMKRIGGAKYNIATVIESWPKQKKWSVLLDHSDIDAISTSIFRLSIFRSKIPPLL